MLILVYSRSNDFLSRHEYAITREGHQCAYFHSDNEIINFIRTNPVDIVYLHAASIGENFEGLLFSLNTLSNRTRVFTCDDLDNPEEYTQHYNKGLFDTIFTCNENPKPFIARLRSINNTTHDGDKPTYSTDLDNAALQSFSIENTSFNWNFSCYADSKAISDNDLLERVTRGSQSLLVPVEHRRNILIILTELYNNAIDHGVLGLDSELKQDVDGFARFYELRASKLSQLVKGFIDIKLSQAIINNKAELTISFKDSGKGFNYDIVNKENIDNNPYGRGITILSKLCKSVEFKGCGNEVTVIYEWAI